MKRRLLIIAFAALAVALSSGQFGQWRPSTSNCCPQGDCQTRQGQTYAPVRPVAPPKTSPQYGVQVPAPSRIVSPFVWSIQVPAKPKPKPPSPGPLAPVEPVKPKPQPPAKPPDCDECLAEVAELRAEVEKLQKKIDHQSQVVRTLNLNFDEHLRESRKQPVFKIADSNISDLVKRLPPIHVKVEVLDKAPKNPQYEQDVYLGGTLPLRLFPVPPKPK